MYNSQTYLLLSLAKKLEKNERSKESAMRSLNSAGILTKSGKVAKTYPNLSRAITLSK
jgi:hypothetical protein